MSPTSLRCFCVGCELVLDQHAGRLGRRVDDQVRRRVVRSGRVVQPADRPGEDRNGLSRLERRMLDAVEHLDALVDRRAGARVVGEPHAFHRRHRDDPAPLAADPRVVDDRRLRGVVRPLVAGHLLPPPLLAARHQVDGDQRVGARRGAGAQARLVERRRRAGAEVDGVRRRVDRDRSPDGAAADEPPALTPLGLRRRDRPVRVRPGGRQVRAPRHDEAADPVLRAGSAHQHAALRADRRARLPVAVVRRRAGNGGVHGHAREQPTGRCVERDEVHVERREEQAAAAVRDAAVRADAEVREQRGVRRLVAPDHTARRAVQGEDVVVGGRHVDAAVDDERVRLLPAEHRGVERAEVHVEHATESADVRSRDLPERRVPGLVERAAPAEPVAGRGRSCADRGRRARGRDHQCRGDGSDEDSHDERFLHALLHVPERRGRVSLEPLRSGLKRNASGIRLAAAKYGASGIVFGLMPWTAVWPLPRSLRARASAAPSSSSPKLAPSVAAASRSSSRRLSSCGKYAASGRPDWR